jgi:hydrogenase expression/formation protein HypE
LFVDESRLPMTADVRGVCELLGLDPLHVACEGTMLLAVPAGHASSAIGVLRSIPVSQQATVIGEVRARAIASVTIRRVTGRELPLDEPLGAPLPRIC